jgi:hypothetical protein
MHNIPFKTFYIDFTLIRTLKQQNVIHWHNSMYNIKYTTHKKSRTIW